MQLATVLTNTQSERSFLFAQDVRRDKQGKRFSKTGGKKFFQKMISEDLFLQPLSRLTTVVNFVQNLIVWPHQKYFIHSYLTEIISSVKIIAEMMWIVSWKQLNIRPRLELTRVPLIPISRLTYPRLDKTSRHRNYCVAVFAVRPQEICRSFFFFCRRERCTIIPATAQEAAVLCAVK